MALKSPHRDWKLDEITPIYVRAVGLDQLLTNLWLHILHGARPLVRMGIPFEGVAQVAALMERRREEGFVGFADFPGAAETWLRSDLLRVMKRRPEEFAVARPVHALAARVRGPNRVSSDSDASLIVYDWLHFADPELIDELRDLISVESADESLDLASFALALLGDEQDADRPRPGEEPVTRTPLCLGHARTYCEDLRRLLAYRASMPRTVLVDHVRRLTAFHLGIYLLRLFRIVTDIEQNAGAARLCDACREGRMPDEPCPYRLEMLVDCGEDARSPIAKLAEESWARQEDMLGRYIRSHLALKKLHEFAENLKMRYPSDAVPFETVDQIAAIEAGARPGRLDSYFDSRIDELRSSSGDVGARIQELEGEYRQLGESSFRTYVAVLAYFSERRWLAYHRQLLDSLFDKNSAEGAMRQPLGGRRLRRMALGASLLETLTLIAVVERRRNEYTTRPLRVDRLIAHLDERYDLLVSRPPERYAADPQILGVLAGNVDRLKARLRETGLYTDLSDAFLAQTIKPRIILDGSVSR
jgi:hypothetical protein